MRVAAIEGGGTKFLAAVGNSNTITGRYTRIATTTPKQTFSLLLDYLRTQYKNEPFSAIGIGSFGPLGVDPHSGNYGVIGPTTKPHWSQVSYPEALGEFQVPLAITTDVNAAALAEATSGAGRGCERVIYVTVGTGIGGGFVVNGQLSHGQFHPEMGHMRVTIHPDDPMPDGFCHFHGNCLEGLACGPAIEKRWRGHLGTLDKNHLGVKLQANYLAQMCVNLLLTMTPDAIILGGGVMQTPSLLPKIRRELQKLMNHYLPQHSSDAAVNALIKAPAYAPSAGLIGAALLAEGLR
jgi:fructokinase